MSKKLPKWCEEKAEKYAESRAAAFKTWNETDVRNAEECYLAACRDWVARVEGTEEKDHVYECSAEPYRSVGEVYEYNEGRESLRKVLLGDE